MYMYACIVHSCYGVCCVHVGVEGVVAAGLTATLMDRLLEEEDTELRVGIMH